MKYQQVKKLIAGLAISTTMISGCAQATEQTTPVTETQKETETEGQGKTSAQAENSEQSLVHVIGQEQEENLKMFPGGETIMFAEGGEVMAYAKPTADSNPVWTYYEGEEVTADAETTGISDESVKWYRVRINETDYGYIRAEFLSDDEPEWMKQDAAEEAASGKNQASNPSGNTSNASSAGQGNAAHASTSQAAQTTCDAYIDSDCDCEFRVDPACDCEYRIDDWCDAAVDCDYYSYDICD